MDDDDADGHYAYIGTASSASTPAWDFASVRQWEPGTSEAKERAKWVLPGGSGLPVVAGEKDAPLQDDGEPKEWIAQVEPGVHITFLSLPGGTGNDLKRIRFRFINEDELSLFFFILFFLLKINHL